MEALQTLDFAIEAIEAMKFPVEPKKRGRKPDLALQDFIFRLHGIYIYRTGRDPLEGVYRNAISDRYEGRFVRLAEYILGQFVPDLAITNASIGEHVRRTIGDRS